MKQQKYITGTKQLALYLGMNPRTVKNLIEKGIIPRRKLGVNNIFLIDEIKSAISDPI